MLEGLPYVAILLLLLLLLLVLFLILLFIFLFLLCASRLSTRQSNFDGTLGLVSPQRQRKVPRTAPRSPAFSRTSPCYSMQARSNPQPPGVENREIFPELASRHPHLPPQLVQNLLFTLSDSLAADAPFPGQIVLAAAVPEELADQASVKGPRSPGSDRPHGRGWSGGAPHPSGRPHSWGSPRPACGVGPSEPRSHDRGRGSRPSLTGGDRRGVSEKSGRSSCA